MYNTHMAISPKYSKLIDEYLLCFNAQKAGEAVGYKPSTARQAVYKVLQKPEIKEELNRRLQAGRITETEIIARLEAMASGELPTKVVKGSHSREEYDTESATEKLGKIYAMFKDRIDIEIQHLNITDDEDA